MACRTTKEFLSFRKYDNRFFADFYVYSCHRYTSVKTTVLYITFCNRLLAEYVMYVAVEIRK